MTDPATRRQFIRAGVAAGAIGLAGCKERKGGGTQPADWGVGGQASRAASTGGIQSAEQTGAPVDVRGAIYVPTRAYNVYQMWDGYDRTVVERDVGYASSLNLNALRVWLSYEYWSQNEQSKQSLGKMLEHFVSTAESEGIRPLVGLFDPVGNEANPQTLNDRDIDSAVAVGEPGSYIVGNSDHWSGVRRYVGWFMDQYADDDRLLGISVMNEPGWNEDETRFARAMTRDVLEQRGSVPITMGATSLINSAKFADWGVDVLQFHYNFPRSPGILENLCREANELSRALDMRVWLTEWQRVRTSGGGFAGEVEGDEWAPKYRTVAPILRRAGMGNFFWSLMLKPAWTLRQRELGVINGLFHEDGAVWSRADATAIKAMSGDDSFDGEERQQKPEWMRISESDGE